jgi:hypothetical protein
MKRAAGLVGLTLLMLPNYTVWALDFSRHNADSPRLNAISARVEIVEGDTDRLLEYIKRLPSKWVNEGLFKDLVTNLARPGGNVTGTSGQ